MREMHYRTVMNWYYDKNYKRSSGGLKQILHASQWDAENYIYGEVKQYELANPNKILLFIHSFYNSDDPAISFIKVRKSILQALLTL